MTRGLDTRWWDKAYRKAELSERLHAAAHDTDSATTGRQQTIIEGYALYGQAHSGSVAGLVPINQRSGINVIAGAVDTLVAEVSQSETSPMVATVGGSWHERRKAKKLTSYVDALFEECEVQSLLRQACRDAIIAGLGVVRPVVLGDEVGFERIHPLNLLVDDRACVDVLPRELYVRRAIDRRHLMAKYPKQRSEIESAAEPSDAFWYPLDSTADVVEVIEGWHLATASGADDGRHVVAVSNCVLVDESYDDTAYPLAFIRAAEQSAGFWGESLVMRAAPAQLTLNKLIRRIDEAQHLVSVPRVFLQTGSGVQRAHVTNDVGAIVEYSGAPPVFLTPTAMSPEVYQHVERLKSWAFELMGISQLSAQSVKPSGLDSGTAIRNYHDFQSRRFINLERSVERAACRLAFLAICAESDLADSADGPHKVRYRDHDGLTDADWSAIDLPRDRMRVQVLASAALPKTAAGRLQALQELLAAGVIDQNTFWQLADMPDFEGARAEATSPDEYIRKTLDKMLEGGQYTPPEPYIDFARAMTLCSRTLQQAEIEGAPESGLELLRQWMAGVHDLEKRGLQKAKQDQAQAMADAMSAAGPPMTPPGGPAAPPVGPEAMPPPPPGGPIPGDMPMPMGAPPMPASPSPM